MKNKSSVPVWFLSMVLSGAAAAACEKPTAPAIPDGATADEDAMIDAQHAVKDYMAKADQYLDCVVNENKAAQADGTDTPESKQARSSGYEEVFKARETVPGSFNGELRKFKARPDQQ